jgi:uncharacterized protein
MTADTPRRRHGLPLLALLATTACLLLGCSLLDTQQREWIFQPSNRTWWGGLAAAEGMNDVWIEHQPADRSLPVRLHGLWLEGAPSPTGTPAPVLLHLHGARWDVRGSAHRARRLHELGFAVLSLDYRGFGQSSAELPSEATALEDARAAWAWLGQQHPGRPRYIFGHSLGGAIAVALAAGRKDVAGLLVEGSFPSIPAVVRSHPWGWLPVGPLITQRFDAAARIGEVMAPVLVAHGAQDRLINPELGRSLFDAAPAPKRFLLVEGGSHHNTMAVGLPQYRRALIELFGLGDPPQASLAPGTDRSTWSSQPGKAQDTARAESKETSTVGSTPIR